MTLKEKLEQHLTDKALKDSSFAEKFDIKKINACTDYVTEQARKKLFGKNGIIEDDLVFSWAESFFTGSENVLNTEIQPAPRIKTWAEAKKELEERKHKKKRKAEAPEKPRVKEPGQLLFDFMEA